MIHISSFHSVMFVFFLASSPAFAATKTINLPPETAQLKKSAHPGYAIAQQKCSICHSADYINLQPPGMNLSQWTKEVTKMQHAYGAPITDDDIKTISAYLASTYGSEKPAVATPDKVAVDVTAKTANAAADSKNTELKNIDLKNNELNKIDLKSLLANNACLSCHAIQQKVVGPAYHDIAERYRQNPEALEIVMKNIQSGGADKWGTTAMPPFATLSNAELKALAQFVLSQ